MLDFIDLPKALSDPNRVRVLMMLRGGELCVCQIIKLLGLSPSTVSKHMSLLRQAGLVRTRKQGRWTYYRLAGRGAPRPVRGAIRWVQSATAEDEQVKADAREVQRVSRMSKSRLCACYEKAESRPGRRRSRT